MPRAITISGDEFSDVAGFIALVEVARGHAVELELEVTLDVLPGLGDLALEGVEARGRGPRAVEDAVGRDLAHAGGLIAQRRLHALARGLELAARAHGQLGHALHHQVG